MRKPLAFLLTVRTYGTWLHGDERGSVDRLHNAFGALLLDADEHRLNRENRWMHSPPLVFDHTMRQVVHGSVVDTCRFHDWLLIEHAVRTNHMHLVVGFAGLEPERMMQRLKARATRALRERKLVGSDQPVWVDGPGSRCYLWTESDVADAATYVREYQDDPR